MEEQKIALKVADGVALDAVFNVVSRALAVVLSVAVARLITPADYGAVALALAAYGVAETLTDLSLGTALIRQRELGPTSVDVAWTLGLVRSALLSVALFAGAPLLSKLLGHAEVVPYLRVLAFGSLTLHAQNLHAVQFQRELRFGRALLLENSRFMLGALASLALLMLTRDPMSLAVGPVVGNSITAVGSWFLIQPRPRFAFSTHEARELVQFGRWIFGVGVLAYLFGTLDSMYVGRFIGLAAAGTYALAWRVVNTIMALFTRSIGRVLMPAYSAFQDDPARLAAAVRVSLSVGAAVAALLGGIVMVSANDLLAVLAGGARWAGAAPVMRALTVSVFAGTLTGVLAPVFHAVGDPRAVMLTSVVQLLALLPAMVVGHHLVGVTGVAIGVAFAASLRAAVIATWASRRFGLGLGSMLRAVTPGVAIALAVTAFATLPQRLPLPPIFRLLAVGTWSLTAFVAAWEACRRARRFAAWPPLLQPALHVVRSRIAGVVGRLQRSSG